MQTSKLEITKKVRRRREKIVTFGVWINQFKAPVTVSLNANSYWYLMK